MDIIIEPIKKQIGRSLQIALIVESDSFRSVNKAFAKWDTIVLDTDGESREWRKDRHYV